MHDFGTTVLWVYIVLLVIGGLIGYLKAGSKASIIMSSAFAGALVLCATRVISPSTHLDVILLVALLIFFAMRLAKSKKFMPAGMMLILTLAALFLRNVK